MPDALSTEAPVVAPDAMGATTRPAPAPSPSVVRTRVLMVLLGYLPFLHLAAVIALTVLGSLGYVRFGWAWSLAVLYVLPPMVVRTATWLGGARPQGRFDVNSSAFLKWWFAAQWQIIFNRLPFLEELLRMWPGIYSLWMRLWGARVGKFVYWSPGVRVLDRQLLQVGDRVVFGAGVRLNGHVLLPNDSGTMELAVGTISIGSDTLVGGYSLLLAGVQVEGGQVTPPLRTLQPFTTWKDGRRVGKGASDGHDLGSEGRA